MKLKINHSKQGSESMQSNYIVANNIAKQSMKYSGVRSSTTQSELKEMNSNKIISSGKKKVLNQQGSKDLNTGNNSIEPSMDNEYNQVNQVIKSPAKKILKESEPLPKKEKPKKEKVIMSGPLTPRKLIFNSILANIKEKKYETKIDYYKIGKVIGKGAFGKVNLAIHRLTGKFVALKSIHKTFMNDESSYKKVMQEYNILKRARHQNIVRLYESFETETHIVYVMEVCGGGDLLTFVRRRRKLKEDNAKFIFRQIIQGIQYVHSKGVLHRDIKLDNILLTSEGDVKICDFGVSKIIASKS